MSNYKSAQRSVSKMLAKSGTTVTLRVVDGVFDYDPASGKKPLKYLDYDMKAVFFPVNTNHVNAGIVKLGDLEILAETINESVIPKQEQQILRWNTAPDWSITDDVYLSLDNDSYRIVDEKVDHRFSLAVVGQRVTVSGASDPANNRSFTIADVASDGSSILVYPEIVTQLSGSPISIAGYSPSEKYKILAAQAIRPAANVTIFNQIYTRKITQE